MILFQLDETDLRRALVHPHMMIGSDGSSLAVDGELGEGKPHPRSYGTFPRVLGRYAREEGVLGLAEAVQKMTALPADRLGLADRGVIREGARADVVAFDAARWRIARHTRSPIAIPRVSSTSSSTAVS